MTETSQSQLAADLRRWGQNFTPAAQQPESVAQMVMLLDMQDSAPSIQRLRQWAFERIRPTTGEVAIDVGSGTGTVAGLLAALTGPTGLVTGVEPNPKLREIAEQRAGAADSNAVFVDGLAGSLPFADGTADIVWCERVLQHVADAQAALNEFARVLRPGGRLALIDSDHASRVTSDIDHDVEAKVLEAFIRKQANPLAARHIPRQVRDAGLTLEPDIGSAALIMPADIALGSPLLAMACAAAVADGTITSEEADEALRRQRAAVIEGVAFSAVTVFGFVAHKPR